MKKKSQADVRALKDTRGLLPDQDPRMFYEYSSQLRQQQANGLEGLLYKFIPSNLVGLTAYAVDPFSQLKVGLGRITPQNRTRTKSSKSVLDKQTYTYLRRGFIYNDGGTVNFRTSSTSDFNVQQPVESLSKDTTRRTRLAGSENGEFSKWKPVIYSSPRKTVYEYRNDHFYGAGSNPSGGPFWYRSYERIEHGFAGRSAVIAAATVNGLRVAEESRALALMQKHSFGMFSGILPTKRTYTLFRSIAELKDVPRSVSTLRNSLTALRQLADTLKIPGKTLSLIHDSKTVLSQVPKEYVSYFFGWRQLSSDIYDLVQAPPKIARKIDLLIKRNGQASTFRSQRNFVENGMASAGFSYTALNEYGSQTDHSFSRNTTLKMVVNTNFEFPQTDLPIFRKKEFYRQLGVVPTPVDLYNLVPWTWLVDWFTGFGRYLEIIESINSDSNLINWGLITAKVDYELRTSYSGKVDSYQIRNTNGNVPVGETKKNPFTHTSTLHCELQLRRDLSTILDVNATSDTATLSPWQLSILGAILLARTKFTRQGILPY